MTPTIIRPPYRSERDREVGHGGMILQPSAAREDSEFLRRVAEAEVPVLLQGETGVGKEVLARRIAELSPRSQKPFVKLNCAALPAELVESELFGYERGAFTGAFKNTPGMFQVASGGTLLLDEIGDMDFKIQAKLLQVLQDGEFFRVGSRERIKVDVRVIAATHRKLEEEIAAGRFREDLFYRLNIIRIEIPPLRERRDEILPLARLLIARHWKSADPPISITPELSQALLNHSWPGNVRELENVVRTFVVLKDPERAIRDIGDSAARRQITPRRIVSITRAGEIGPGSAGTAPSQNGPRVVDTGPTTDLRAVDNVRRQAEKQAILAALSSTLWNRKQAARMLDIEYKALLYKMRKLRIGEKDETFSTASESRPRADDSNRADPQLAENLDC